jgi:hypothetical protein
MDQPEETNVTQLVLGCVAFVILATALLTINAKINRKEPPMNVATALTDPRVRQTKLYFRAKDPSANDENATALFRIHTDSGAQSLLGAGTWSTLQKLVTEPEPSRPRPYWTSWGGKASIDWLPEEAEFVEPTAEMPDGR